MPVIQIDNLGTPGIVTDIPAHELPLNAWSSGNNVRFLNNAVEKTRGEESVYGTPTIDPYWLMPWADGTNLHWFYANATDIYSVSGTTHVERTRAASDYAAGSYPHWNGGVLGGVPIMNNTALVDPPQSWDASTSKFVDLPHWPAAWEAKVVRPFKQFLIAMDVQESSIRYPTRLRWSSPADPGTVPTDWAPAADNLAGSAPFSETTDFLVDMQPLRDIGVVYKENSTHLMQFVGGTYVFNFKQAFSEFGLLSRRCAKPFFGKHFVLAQGDVVLHDGQSADSIITNKLRRNLFDSMDRDNYPNAFVTAYPATSEMWICIPEVGETFCTRAYIWQWQDNTWTIRDLPRISHLGLGVIDTSSVSNIIDDQTEIIDSYTDPFDSRAYNPSQLDLMMARPASGTLAKQMFEADRTAQFDGSDFTAFVERVGLAITPSYNGGHTVDTRSIKFCQRVYPKIEADAGVKVNVRVGSQDRIGGPVTWGATVAFDPATMKYIDCRVQGVAIAVQFNTNTGGDWRLSSYGLDIKKVGEA